MAQATMHRVAVAGSEHGMAVRSADGQTLELRDGDDKALPLDTPFFALETLCEVDWTPAMAEVEF